MKMRALMDFPYNHGQVKEGDEFDSASDHDAEMLKLFGRAESVDEYEIKIPRRGKYKRRDLRATE